MGIHQVDFDGKWAWRMGHRQCKARMPVRIAGLKPQEVFELVIPFGVQMALQAGRV